MLHLPSGHLDEGEPIPHGAAREAREEVGVEIAPADLCLVTVVHHRQCEDLARVGMFFLAEKWSGEPIVAEPHKAGKLVWADPRALPSNTIPYPLEGIRSWVSGDRLALHGWPTARSRERRTPLRKTPCLAPKAERRFQWNRR